MFTLCWCVLFNPQRRRPLLCPCPFFTHNRHTSTCPGHTPSFRSLFGLLTQQCFRKSHTQAKGNTGACPPKWRHAAGVNCPLTHSGCCGQRSGVELALFKRASNRSFWIFTACLKCVCVHTGSPMKVSLNTFSALLFSHLCGYSNLISFLLPQRVVRKRREGHILTRMLTQGLMNAFKNTLVQMNTSHITSHIFKQPS